ncbi:MAG: hypothetical protein ACHP7N_02225 [Caulobacterales bacterium]
MSPFDVAGLIGVAMILAGYAAATTGRLDAKGAPSLAINLVGASLILLSLTQKFNLSAAIVEGAWALIALVGLVRIALSGRRRD